MAAKMANAVYASKSCIVFRIEHRDISAWVFTLPSSQTLSCCTSTGIPQNFSSC
jgi:hypothetical protein